MKLFGRRGGQITQIAHFANPSVQACSFMPDGKAVAIACKEGRVHLLDLEKSSSLKTIDFGLDSHIVFGKKEYDEIGEIAVSGDGRRIAVHRRTRSVAVWDLHTEKLIFSKDLRTCNTHLSGFTKAIALSPDGGRLAIACSTGNLEARTKYPANYLLDVETGEENTIEGHQFSLVDSPLDNRINDIDFSPDGRFLISVGDDGRAIVWALDPPPGSSQYLGPQYLLKRGNIFWRVCFSHNGKTFATGAFSEWPSDHAPLIETSAVGYDAKFKAIEAQQGIVDYLAFNRDDSKLLVLSSCQEKPRAPVFHIVWLWSEGSLAKRVEHDFGKVLAVSPDASMIASLQDDTLAVWDLTQVVG